MITVFGKNNCPQCTQAVNLLSAKEREYKYVKVLYPGESYDGDSIQLDEFRQQYPHVRMMPYIRQGENEIGGLRELQKAV